MFLVVLILQYFTGYILHACRATDVLLLFFSCNEPSVLFLSGKLVSIVMVIADYQVMLLFPCAYSIVFIMCLYAPLSREFLVIILLLAASR